MKILFVTYEFWPGVANAFKNLKSLIDENFSNIKTQFIFMNQNGLTSSLIRNVKMSPPDILLIGGWDANLKTLFLNCNKKTRVFVYWCSPMTQIDLSNELTRFNDVFDLSKNKKIDYLITSCESDYKNLKIINKNIKYIPIYVNLSYLEEYRDENNKYANNKGVDIFCAPCPRKNILTQVCGLLPYIDKEMLFINYDTSNSASSRSYENFIKKTYNNYMNYGWMKRSKYLSNIQKVKIGMQITLSESFNYVVAEHLFYGIPIFVSSSSPFSKDLKQYGLVVENPQDSQEISKAVEPFLNNNFGEKISKDLNKILINKVSKIKKITLNLIEEIIYL